MKKIKLTKGKFALVDDEDFERLSQWKWSYHYAGYAFRMYRTHYTLHRVAMARFIMNAPDNMVVDHINGNTLDNRKQNLRVCTRAENMRNQKKRITGLSKFKGVSWSQRDKIYRARIQINNRQIFLGGFKREVDAAVAYDMWAIVLHGLYARTNFPVVAHSNFKRT